MNELIHADIFFFITAIATVLLTVVSVVLFVYALKIFRDIAAISKIARRQAELFSEDIAVVRENIKREGATLKNILKFFNVSSRWFGKVGKKKSDK